MDTFLITLNGVYNLKYVSSIDLIPLENSIDFLKINRNEVYLGFNREKILVSPIDETEFLSRQHIRNRELDSSGLGVVSTNLPSNIGSKNSDFPSSVFLVRNRNGNIEIRNASNALFAVIRIENCTDVSVNTSHSGVNSPSGFNNGSLRVDDSVEDAR